MYVCIGLDREVVLVQMVSPNDQFHIVPPTTVELSVNVTVRGAVPFKGVPVNPAVGNPDPPEVTTM